MRRQDARHLGLPSVATSLARKPRLRGAAWLGATCLAGVVAAAGCRGQGAEVGCPPIDPCGGDPTGKWQIQTPESFCEYVPPLTYTVPTNMPPQNLVPPQSMVAQTPGKPPPTPKSAGDWCSSLVYEPTVANAPSNSVQAGGITQVFLPHAPGGVKDPETPIAAVTFTLSSSHEYQVGIKTLGYNHVHFTEGCIQAYGAHPTCSDLAVQLRLFETMPNYQNFSCLSASDGGCDCSYTYQGASADQGSWRVAGNILYFISAFDQAQPIVPTDFCVKDNGNTLVIGGRNGQSMFAENGLRSMTLARVPGP